MKAARIFLGRELPLPSAVASRLLENNRNSNDLSGILLVLPGQAARRSVQQELLKSCPKGLLLPQLLSPHSLLHYSRQEVRLPDQLATALLWGAAISEAEAAPEEFDLVFPDGKFPGNPYTGSKPLVKLRHELVAGGKSIRDAAALLGERGYQRARLEKIFCAGLEAHGYTDPFVNDRTAVDDNAAFADVKKVIIAAIPDLPSVIKDKLAAIAEKYPGKVEIWIYAAEKDQDEYDEAGVPIPEKWENKSFLCNDIFSAADPLDGAKRAIRLTSEPDAETGKDIFDPEKCAVVLADPAMYGVFADEFKKLKTVDGKDLQIIDPSGVPVSGLRIFRLLTMNHHLSIQLTQL